METTFYDSLEISVCSPALIGVSDILFVVVTALICDIWNSIPGTMGNSQISQWAVIVVIKNYILPYTCVFCNGRNFLETDQRGKELNVT